MIYRGFKYHKSGECEWDSKRREFVVVRRGWSACRYRNRKLISSAFGKTKQEAAKQLLKQLRSLRAI